MKIVHTGRGASGSWEVRGVQLGDTAIPMASAKQLKAFDCIVGVKRIPQPLLSEIRKAKRPWVWDLVDFYPQPACSAWDRKEAIRWARGQIKSHRPDGIIFPTQRMAEDVGANLPNVVIHHHHRQGITRNPIRQAVRSVGYEGSEKYLGGLRSAIETACSKRGWRFVVNPRELSSVDICVAFREGQWNGYVQRHWKSNVKLANCHGSGTPFIGPKEHGYLETSSGMEVWAEEKGELDKALDYLSCKRVRMCTQVKFLDNAISVESCRAQLREFVRAQVL